MSMTRSEVEEAPWQEVESSNVARVAFTTDDPAAEKGDLWVEFRNGANRIYRYAGVRREQHAELLDADSVGGYLNAEIKPNHECERVEVVADPPPGPPSPPRSEAHRPVG